MSIRPVGGEPEASNPQALAVAEELLRQRRLRLKVQPIRGDLAAGGLPAAYEAQDLLFELIHGGGYPLGGYKIGMGGRAIRKAYGLSEPASGAIAREDIYASGATVRAGAYMHLAVECEIAVRMGRPFPVEGDDSAETLAESVDAVCASFELVDDRHLDYSDIDVFTMVADNGWNAGLVLGPPSADRAIMHTAPEGHLSVGGRDVFRGTNTDTLSPFDALAWLAGHLVRRGRRLEAGDWVTTGGLTSCFPSPGDDLAFTVGSLEPVHLKIA
jgi:2-keto-4-pentenoate hydratase